MRECDLYASVQIRNVRLSGSVSRLRECDLYASVQIRNVRLSGSVSRLRECDLYASVQIRNVRLSGSVSRLRECDLYTSVRTRNARLKLSLMFACIKRMFNTSVCDSSNKNYRSRSASLELIGPRYVVIITAFRVTTLTFPVEFDPRF